MKKIAAISLDESRKKPRESVSRRDFSALVLGRKKSDENDQSYSAAEQVLVDIEEYLALNFFMFYVFYSSL